MKRIAILALAALIMAAIVATAAYAAPRIFTHTAVGTNGNDDLIAPFGRIGQQDTAYGLNGRDEIFGDNGDDKLYGGNGNDRILSDYEADYIVGGQGRDYLSGNAHADIIEAADGQKDYVYCGSGENDRASVDEKDVVGGCEFVNGEPAE